MTQELQNANMLAATAQSAKLIAGNAARQKRRNSLVNTVSRPLSIIAFFTGWLGITLFNNNVHQMYNPMLIPTPIQVVGALVRLTQSGELLQDIAASMYRVIMGFIFAGLAGVGVGVGVSKSRVLSNMFEPLIEMFRPIPSLAFLPMLILWFGIGETSKIIFVAYAAFYPILSATILGMMQIDPILIRAAQSLGASKREIFFLVELPAVSPSIFSGLKLGFATSFFVIVAAEYVAATSGLGYEISNSRTYFDIPTMIAAAAVIGLLGYLINVVLTVLERYLLRWNPKYSGN